ncbi:hypothetical protein MTR_7g072770 [Medicago truncatula]|uniref:Uncharacterized protein n=1 Tax=Medicago truncatula TaxID=3880 RepID=G7KX41_MEDTR|nr:hypothetical protein MTR_7g072770 [Medicago truncatula]
MIEKKLVRIEQENGNRLLPKVYLEPKVFQELCTPWKDALVVKLMGKTSGYNTMNDRLKENKFSFNHTKECKFTLSNILYTSTAVLLKTRNPENPDTRKPNQLQERMR